jgi:hypothetical protein
MECGAVEASDRDRSRVRLREGIMSPLIRVCLFGLIVTLLGSGCAPRQAATTWGASRWYKRYGAGEPREFEAQRERCLEAVGVAGDPANVAPESARENAFLRCMNRANWCSDEFACNQADA